MPKNTILDYAVPIAGQGNQFVSYQKTSERVEYRFGWCRYIAIRRLEREPIPHSVEGGWVIATYDTNYKYEAWVENALGSFAVKGVNKENWDDYSFVFSQFVITLQWELSYWTKKCEEDSSPAKAPQVEYTQRIIDELRYRLAHQEFVEVDEEVWAEGRSFVGTLLVTLDRQFTRSPVSTLTFGWQEAGNMWSSKTNYPDLLFSSQAAREAIWEWSVQKEHSVKLQYGDTPRQRVKDTRELLDRLLWDFLP